jgi:xylulokinase
MTDPDSYRGPRPDRPASGRYVIGLDSSTQSVKAVVWDAEGRPVAEGRASHTIRTPDAIRAEQDAGEWWTAAQAALRAATAQIDPATLDGLAISNQRETMVFTDHAGMPLAPATLWFDRRAKASVADMTRVLGEGAMHRITGKPVDVVPCAYRLHHFAATDPALMARVERVLSVHDLLTLHLTGAPAATWTSADNFGLFDIAGKHWSDKVMGAIGLPLSLLPPVHRPGARVGTVSAAAAALTGLPEGLPVFAAGGDGHCAALGAGAVTPGTVYLNLGTALVGGAWSANPDLSRYWRTLISQTGEGYLLETVQLAGAFFVNWLIDTFGGGRADPSVFTRLESQAAALPVGSGGVTVCSYLTGVMDPHWDETARATFTGLSADTGMGHLYRASLEALTLEFARALAQMRGAGVPLSRIVVIGGGASSKLWQKMIADATGLPVFRGRSDEASALGAGISAAVGAGWYDGFAGAADGMTAPTLASVPDPAAAADWAALSARQAGVYPANRAFSTPSAG